MKKFSFRLDSYLRISRHQEQLEQLRLTELMEEERRTRDAIQDLQSSWANTSTELSSHREIHSFEIGWYRQRMDFIEQQIEETENRLAALLERVAVQRERVVEARKKVRIVEKLRERRLERFQFELDRTLQNEMDDLFLLTREGRPFLAD
jgi:flagellar export protein FliJ